MTERRDGREHSYVAIGRRERPWLLPYNRRLRHLQGITIRGLTFTQPAGRSRGKTIDDAGIPSTFQSPSKVLAQRESKKLEHSRSFTNLRASATTSNDPALQESQPGIDSSPKRPTSSRLRRRSTLNWVDVSMAERQRKLEDITSEKMVDSFFSLHAEGQADPIYTSEIVEQAMNPNFRFFDLQSNGPAITRLNALTLKVWAKTGSMKTFQYLIELNINMRFLQFIGKSLENFHHPLPPNSIIFHLKDGVYTSFIDLSSEPLGLSTSQIAKSSSSIIQPTSSYDALMRLSTLDECIQDALSTRVRLTNEIDTILKNNEDALARVNNVPEAQENLRSIEARVATQRRKIDAVKKKRSDLIENIQSRKKAMQRGREAQSQAQRDLTSAQENLEECRKTLAKTREEMTGQRRRICEEILAIYPIEPVAGKALSFTIRDLYLPNSESEDANDEIAAAALGHVAHIVNLLSFYLSHPLPYPVRPCSSVSTIQDPISLTAGSRTYPLFGKGAIRYRYEYGVFLLNKNIEVLANSLGLRIMDIRQTLPNLKYLLYVATAGQGELPSRKAGGVRGLLRRGEEHGFSRRSSMESTTSSTEEAKSPVDSLQDDRNDALRRPNGKQFVIGTSKRGYPVGGSKLKEVIQ